MRSAATALLLVALLVAAGPTSAGDDEEETARLNLLALDRFLEGQARVMRVSDPIRIAAAPFCGDGLVSVIGVYAANQSTFLHMIPRDLPFEKALNASAVGRFALDKRPRILLVVPGLPAARAGVRPGDVVTRLDGQRLNRRVQLDSLRTRNERVRLTIERAGGPVELELERRLGCADPSRFMFGTNVNAFATHYGRNTGIYAYGGMLTFLESDDELAVIMGHELAHMILKHTQQGITTQKHETDADYLGLYLAARAGFDVSKAIDVEDKVGRTNPYSTIDWGYYSHPISPARSLMLRSTVAEIRGKQERGEPLQPGEGSR